MTQTETIKAVAGSVVIVVVGLALSLGVVWCFANAALLDAPVGR
jgi:hypothetical protein